jgi:hypothetical protein
MGISGANPANPPGPHPPPPPLLILKTQDLKGFKVIGGLLCLLISSGLAIIRPFFKLIAKIVLSPLQTYY